MRLVSFTRSVIDSLEESKTPLYYTFLSFIFVVTLRYFLELYSDSGELSLLRYTHYALAYSALAGGLIILFHYATRTTIECTIRIVLPSFLILLLPPVIDLLLSGGEGYNMAYMLPNIHDGLWGRYLHFFGEFSNKGVTIGIRTEIALVLIASFLYFYIKKNSVIIALALSWLTYTLIFLYGAMPFLLRFIQTSLGYEYEYSDALMRDLFLTLLLILGAWIYLRHSKSYSISFLKDMRYLRISHFILILLLGMVLAPEGINIDQNEIFQPLLVCSAIIFAAIFSIITNNIEDIEIDKVCNRNRPTITGAIPIAHYTQIAWSSLGLSLLYASAVSIEILFLILLCIGNYFIYSMPPYRLKRVPLFSKLIIAFNTLACFLMGYLLSGGSFNLPLNTVTLSLLALTATINFIDIKDYEGDRAAGIKTLPTLLGLKWSKRLIGLFFLLSYSLSYFVTDEDIFIIPSIITGIILYLLINKKSYDERPIFIIHLGSIALLILFFHYAIE